MAVRYPAEFLSIANFELAWERILRGSNIQYKRFFSHLYPSYRFAARTILADLVSEVRNGTYAPSSAITVYFPKPTRILRPITLLSLNDQVVYQAIANVVASRFFRKLRPHYLMRTFGALYSGKGSKFFYRSWKRSYRAFNSAIRKAHRDGNDVVADFDLVSFFDLIDHKVLRRVLARHVKSGELLDLLERCLGEWSSGNPGVHTKGHGIPQGPEPSAFLAEVFLHEFDLGHYGRVKYFRYVDDIKLLGKDFSPVRRALLRLDLRSKNLGLVPQAQKIEIRRVKDIDAELKSVPSSIAGGVATTRSKPLTPATRRRLERMLRKAVYRRRNTLTLDDETRFKFALNRLPGSLKILRFVEPLFLLRPDLSGTLARYASLVPASKQCADILHRSVKSDPVFDASAGDYVMALDKCAPNPEPTKYRVAVAKLMSRSEERSLLLGVPSKIYRYKRMSKSAATAAFALERPDLATSLLIYHAVFDLQHAFVTARDLAIPIRQFAAQASDADLARYCTYLMLTELALIPRKPQPSGALLLKHLGLRIAPKPSLLLGFFHDLFGLTADLPWERLLGKRAHSEVQRRSALIRGYWGGNPSLLVTALDSFNDLLIQRFSMKHSALGKAFKKAAGPKKKFPDYGRWLKQNALKSVLPTGLGTLAACHDLRVKADLAHAVERKTGRFTRPISYKEAEQMTKRLSVAYRELLAKWSKL